MHLSYFLCLSPSSCSFIAYHNSGSLPKSINESISHHGQHDAMIEEMNALDGNGTRKLVDIPPAKEGYQV